MSDAVWPSELKLKEQGHLFTISFDDGSVFELTAEYLRVMSPSAEVQGHSPSERKLQHGKAKVAIIKIEPVGNYAVRLTFDDMHSTGIYSWPYLHGLGVDHPTNWPAYLDELAEKGLSR